RVRARVRTHDRFLRENAAVRAALPDDYAAGGGGHADPYDLPLHRYSQRFFSGAGYRRHPRHFPGSANHRLGSHGGKTAGARQDYFARSSGRKPLLLHRRGWYEYHHQQRANVHQSEAAQPERFKRFRRDPSSEIKTRPGRGNSAFYAAGAEHYRG